MPLWPSIPVAIPVTFLGNKRGQYGASNSFSSQGEPFYESEDIVHTEAFNDLDLSSSLSRRSSSATRRPSEQPAKQAEPAAIFRDQNQISAVPSQTTQDRQSNES